jgi:NADH:ubiquinone oxidoreductase subunit 3 (subunit A)
MSINLFSPVLAFAGYLLLVALITWFGRRISPTRPTDVKVSTYASGEEAPHSLAAPGYQPFFTVSLFFAILHLGVLVLASGDFSPTMALFVGGLIMALLALILG